LDYFKINSDLDDLVKRISGDKFKWHNWDYNTGRVAIEQGLEVIVYTRSAGIFDPTWFNFSSECLLSKLKEEHAYFEKEEYVGLPSFKEDIDAAIRFLEAGGIIDFTPISKRLIRDLLREKKPLIAGVSYTLLVNAPRERYFPEESCWKPDDIKGHPYGHVVVISGYRRDSFQIIDPWPQAKEEYYVKGDVLIDAILRNDSNLLAFSWK
jgi:hypothetical protein